MSANPNPANVLSSRLMVRAKEAIAVLNVEPFIKEHEPTLFQRLLEADRNAEAAPVDADMMFIVLSLPIASSVIHLASTREDLAEARDWVRRIWDTADPVPILSTLTLVHIVRLAYDANRRAVTKNPAWDRIAHRVKKLTEEMAEEERRQAEEEERLRQDS